MQNVYGGEVHAVNLPDRPLDDIFSELVREAGPVVESRVATLRGDR